MTEFVGTILRSQYEAALAMLKSCIATCADEHYEGQVARDTFRTIAYHTHIYNLRHIQHHTGALSAYLRRVDPRLQDRAALRWVRMGWPSDEA